MSLSTIKELFGKYKFILISLVLLAFFSALIIIRLYPKTDQTITADLPQNSMVPQQTSQTNITFTGNEVTVPQRMAPLSLESSPVSQEAAQQLASGAGFLAPAEIIQAPENETILLWRNDNKSLVIKISTQILQYEQEENTQSTQTVAPEAAQTSTLKFLTNIGRSQNLSVPGVSYLETLEENEQKTSSPDSKYVVLTFKYLIDSLPVIFNNSNDTYIESIVDGGGVLKKLQVEFLSNITTTPNSPQKTKTFAQVLEEVRAGRGTYLSSIGEEPRYFSDILPQIDSLELASAELEYYLDKKNNILVPVIAFKGRALLNNNREENVFIVVPVLETTPSPN
ncbi:MAG: hypothetical protein WD988_02155 [Candidatus Curtissbacteria bacterium]